MSSVSLRGLGPAVHPTTLVTRVPDCVRGIVGAHRGHVHVKLFQAEVIVTIERKVEIRASYRQHFSNAMLATL